MKREKADRQAELKPTTRGTQGVCSTARHCATTTDRLSYVDTFFIMVLLRESSVYQETKPFSS